jgi:hypothetical protein
MSKIPVFIYIFGEILSLRQVFSNLVSPPQTKTNLAENAVAQLSFPDEQKTVTETSFDCNLFFLRKKKKKNNTLEDDTYGMK